MRSFGDVPFTRPAGLGHTSLGRRFWSLRGGACTAGARRRAVGERDRASWAESQGGWLLWRLGVNEFSIRFSGLYGVRWFSSSKVTVEEDVSFSQWGTCGTQMLDTHTHTQSR